MRIVTSTELSEEQEKIYYDSPFEGVIIIIGPPGSGKTIMGLVRANALSEYFEKITIVMFNQVLFQFTKNGVNGKNVNAKTLYSWLGKWWLNWYGRFYPTIYIPGVKFRPPDFDEMIVKALGKQSKENIDSDRINWGHLIIDEGQDFSNQFYGFMNRFRSLFFNKIEPPSMTILADENQRLREDNSTIAEIKELLVINDNDGQRTFHLSKNYRNSDPINEISNYFYPGLGSGKTDPSGRDGPKPVLVKRKSSEEMIDYIVKYVKKHENEEIGIVVGSDDERKEIYNRLKDNLDEKYFNVQTYAYYEGKASKLIFDEKGITILNLESIKGLEFDAVFIPYLENRDTDSDNIEIIKMNMYVMCSRARNFLALMMIDYSSNPLPMMNLLPAENKGILEYDYEK